MGKVNDVNHERFQEVLLGAFDRAEDDAAGTWQEALPAEASAHARACAECGALLTALLMLSQSHASEEPPSEYWQGFTASLERRLVTSTATAPRRSAGPLRFAAAAALLVGCMTLAWRFLGEPEQLAGLDSGNQAEDVLAVALAASPAELSEAVESLTGSGVDLDADDLTEATTPESDESALTFALGLESDPAEALGDELSGLLSDDEAQDLASALEAEMAS